MKSHKYPKLNDKEWLENKIKKKNMSEISKELGCSAQAVKKMLTFHGIEIQKHPKSHKYPNLNNKDWLERKIKKISMNGIARELNCSSSIVFRMLQFHEIENPRCYGRFIPELYDEVWLTQKYITDNMGFNEIAELLDTSPRKVSESVSEFGLRQKSRKYKYPQLNDKKWLSQYKDINTVEMARQLGPKARPQLVMLALKEHNIKLRPRGKYERVPKYPQLVNKKWLNQKYNVEKLSALAIGEMVGCEQANVKYHLKKFKFKIRNPKEASRIRHNRNI